MTSKPFTQLRLTLSSAGSAPTNKKIPFPDEFSRAAARCVQAPGSFDGSGGGEPRSGLAELRRITRNKRGGAGRRFADPRTAVSRQNSPRRSFLPAPPGNTSSPVLGRRGHRSGSAVIPKPCRHVPNPLARLGSTMTRVQKRLRVLNRWANSNYLHLKPCLLLKYLFFLSNANKEPNCTDTAEAAL